MPKSNLLAGRRALLDGMQGHNFALPDCLQYLFERTGAFGTLDYWNFAALTGDVCAQVYDRGRVSAALRQYADRLEEALALMREAAALV